MSATTETPELPAVPKSRDELLIAALRHAESTSVLLNQVGDELYRVLGGDADNDKWKRLFALLRRRYAENSALHLFLAATSLNIDLPPDLQAPQDAADIE